MKINMPIQSWKKPIHILAFGFGSGASPFFPGTIGTIAAIPFCILLLSFFDAWYYTAIVLLLFIFGVYLCHKTSSDLGVHDHSGIVWDEFVGLFITMIAVPLTISNVVCAFVFFRFFDIVKPWPINYIDKRVNGGLGIMLDDVLAGIFANIALQLVLHFSWI